jgi:hypothetical protein
MNTNWNHRSAKIYQFPAGGRAALGGRRYGEGKSIEEKRPHASDVLSSSSWYHEEAIRESAPALKPLWER